MTYPRKVLTTTWLLGSMLIAAPTWAGSVGSAGSAGSSASSAGSASLKGSSTSIEASSGASSTSGAKDTTAMVQTGTYRLVAIAPAADAPETVRLTLAPMQMPQAEGFVLRVPRQALTHPLQAGEHIHAVRRDYGVQFAHAQGPFFLVLTDAWQRELQSTPITH